VLLEHDGAPVEVPGGGDPGAILEQFGYVGQLQAVVADVAAARRPIMSAAFGRDVLQVVCAAYESAGRSGASVALPFAGRRDLTPLELWRAGGAPFRSP
jgi:hypothetical protein